MLGPWWGPLRENPTGLDDNTDVVEWNDLEEIAPAHVRESGDAIESRMNRATRSAPTCTS